MKWTCCNEPFMLSRLGKKIHSKRKEAVKNHVCDLMCEGNLSYPMAQPGFIPFVSEASRIYELLHGYKS